MKGLTISNLFRKAAVRYPEREAIIFEGTRLKYRELNERVNRLANGLISLGVNKGDNIAILSRNCNEYLETYFACNKIGAVIVTINFRLAPKEVQYQINQSESKFLFVEAEYQKSIISIYDDIGVNKEAIIVYDGQPQIEGGYEYEKFIAEYPDNEPNCDVGSDDPCLMLYTSGTTGLQKGALLTNANVIWDSHGYNWSGELLRSRSKIMQTGPFIHVGGIHMWTLLALFKGLTVVFTRQFDPKETLEVLQKERCTELFILIGLLIPLLNHPDIRNYDLSALHTIGTAAASYTKELMHEAMDKLGVDNIHFYYGLTEAAPIVTMTTSTRETLNKENCLGWPLYYDDCKIVDEDGNEVKTGDVGELLVRGPNIFKGYYNMPEETAKALRGGWLHTGDLVKADEDGCVFFVDRRKDMIKTGGENVFAIEVEVALMKANPELQEVSVIGIPDDRWGEAVRAIAILRKGVNKVSEEEVIKRTREYIAGYKLPKSVIFVDDFPRSTSGKVQKVQLRKMYSKK